jgi:hypothetical protein
MDERDYDVVDFQFIDDKRCLLPLTDSFDDGMSTYTDDDVQKKKEILSSLFKNAGWEGDGEINCIALSPCFSGRDDGWCDIIYHVKQSNNGTSWLAIPKSLKLQLPDGFLTK